MTTGAMRQAAAGDATDARFQMVLREIARGGLAGLLVGLAAGGIGGRIVMRIAALLVPEAGGAFTENGNRVGEITLQGSLTLLAFGALAGAIAAPIWVVVSPWIPGSGWRRAVLAVPVALAFGLVGLVDGANHDFFVLRRDPAVIAILAALVAAFGVLFVLVDEALDRRLPPASGRAATGYALLSVVGMVVVVPLALAFVSATEPLVVLTGLGLVAVGLATLYRWILLVGGREEPSWLPRAGLIALVAAMAVGSARGAVEVARAAGLD